MAKAGKFVLTIGDEGGILTYFQGNQVTRRLYAPTPNYTDTRAFLEVFESDRKAPIYVLVDMMDQSYVQQSLPPVSSLSVNKLIKRKMERDFAADDLKGALLIGREKEGRRDWKYLFVTLSHSPQLESWIDLIIELPNHFVGLYPLPVEAENFIHRLREATTGQKFKAPSKKDAGDASAPKWQLLVAHNKVGGFRQVVLKEGKLVFARLAQPIGDAQPDVIAGSIEQEISVTVEYLKRLGYNDEQGMEAYIITSEAIKSSISPANLHIGSVHIFSPHQAAQKMGLEQATEPQDQFADSLLAAAFISAKKHALRLDTEPNRRINQLYQGIMALKVGGAIVTLAAVGALGYYGISAPLAKSKITEEEAKSRSLTMQVSEMQNIEKDLPTDLESITDLVSIHQSLSKLSVSPMTMLRQYAQATHLADVRLSKFDWAAKSDPLTATQGNNNQPQNGEETHDEVEVSFSVEFFETKRGTNAFNTLLDEYLKELGEAFPGYNVSLTSPRPGVSEEQKKTITLTGDEVDPLLDMSSITMTFSVSKSAVADNNAASQYGGGAW